MEGTRHGQIELPVHPPPLLTLTLLQLGPAGLLRTRVRLPRPMPTRTVEDAELSDTAPSPLRQKSTAPVSKARDEPSSSAEMDTSMTMQPEPTPVALKDVPPTPLDPLGIHGWDYFSIFENLSPVQRNLWEMVEGSKVLAYRAYGGRISGLDDVSQLSNGIKAALGLRSPPVVAPPTPAPGRQKGDSPPYCALVSNISAETAETLVERRFLVTEGSMTIFLDFIPPPYTFVTTLKGFVLPGRSPTETVDDVNGIVAHTLFEGGSDSETTRRIRRFLANCRDNIPPSFFAIDDTVKYLRKTIAIEYLELVGRRDVGTGEGKGHLAWNLYIEPPTTSSEGLREWRKLIRRIVFVTTTNGAGSTYRTFRCTVCRSENHPGGMCALPEQPGWVKPMALQSAALAEILNDSGAHPNDPRPNRGGRGGRNRGRGRGPRGRGRGASLA